MACLEVRERGELNGLRLANFEWEKERGKKKEKDFWDKIMPRVNKGLANSKRKSGNYISTSQIFPKLSKITLWP